MLSGKAVRRRRAVPTCRATPGGRLPAQLGAHSESDDDVRVLSAHAMSVDTGFDWFVFAVSERVFPPDARSYYQPLSDRKLVILL